MRIMLIDDDTATLGIVKAFLLRMNHEVMDFSDSREAVESLSQDHIGLVISDIKMPHLDGFEVAEKVAGMMGTTPPKVLLVSGNAGLSEKLDLIPPSVVIGVLSKPFDRHELSRVVSLLEKTRSCCPGTIGPFCMYVPENQTDETKCEFHPTSGPTDYSRCVYYDNHCGRMLRTWVARQSCGSDLNNPNYGPGSEPLLSWPGAASME